MIKSNKKNGKYLFEDEIETRKKAAAHRHSKMNKYQSDVEQNYDFDDEFEYAEEVKHFLKK